MKTENCQNQAIKRSIDGSIDFEYYNHRAKQLRSESFWTLIGKLMLGKNISCEKLFQRQKWTDFIAKQHFGGPSRC